MDIKRTEYLLYADQCRQMADRTKSAEVRTRWLVLAGNWLRLAGEEAEDEADSRRADLKIVK